jgi:tetraacyldisaccharide 4'-kinase
MSGAGPLPAALAPITAPAAWLYGRVIAARNRRFDGGRDVGRVGVPVISVGNLTTGGAGKTPFVAWLAERLLAAGRRPVIAMRGYGARAGRASDEAREHAERLPDVDVVADPDRRAALGAYLPAHPEVDCVLLDDGFQHRRLHRDLDLVLVDASRPTLSDRLLPRGHLREPPSALRRADAVVVTRAAAVDDALAEEIRRSHGREPLAWSRHAWTRLRRFDADGDGTPVDVAWLTGRRVAAMLGVGHPEATVAQMEAAGAVVTARVPARDHEHYTPAKLDRARAAAAGADALVMTGKDWVKARDLIDLTAWTVPILVPDLAIEVFAGEADLTSLVLAAAGPAT